MSQEISFDPTIATNTNIHSAILYSYLAKKEQNLFETRELLEEALKEGRMGQDIFFSELKESFPFFTDKEIHKSFKLLNEKDYLRFWKVKTGYMVFLLHGLKEGAK